jgi:hypothetical protein
MHVGGCSILEKASARMYKCHSPAWESLLLIKVLIDEKGFIEKIKQPCQPRDITP